MIRCWFKEEAERNVLDYVSQFRKRLHQANSLPMEALSNSQVMMKCH